MYLVLEIKNGNNQAICLKCSQSIRVCLLVVICLFIHIFSKKLYDNLSCSSVLSF